MDWVTGEYELFEVREPTVHSIPFVYNSPHSGRCYPVSFLEASRLDSYEIRRSEDCFVDELFASAPDIGAPLLKANFPRAYLDVNREPYELDPRMFDGALPSYANIGSMRLRAVSAPCRASWRKIWTFTPTGFRWKRGWRASRASISPITRACAGWFRAPMPITAWPS